MNWPPVGTLVYSRVPSGPLTCLFVGERSEWNATDRLLTPICPQALGRICGAVGEHPHASLMAPLIARAHAAVGGQGSDGSRIEQVTKLKERKPPS